MVRVFAKRRPMFLKVLSISEMSYRNVVYRPGARRDGFTEQTMIRDDLAISSGDVMSCNGKFVLPTSTLPVR